MRSLYPSRAIVTFVAFVALWPVFFFAASMLVTLAIEPFYWSIEAIAAYQSGRPPPPFLKMIAKTASIGSLQTVAAFVVLMIPSGLVLATLTAAVVLVRGYLPLLLTVVCCAVFTGLDQVLLSDWDGWAPLAVWFAAATLAALTCRQVLTWMGLRRIRPEMPQPKTAGTPGA